MKRFFEKFIHEIQIEKFTNNANGKKIIIWGANLDGKSLYELLINKNQFVYAFIDEKASEINFEFGGIKIELPEFLKENEENYYVFVAKAYKKEIENFLIENNYMEVSDYLYILHETHEIEKDEEYVDIYGNKIKGIKGTKINFMGYNSILNIGSECNWGEKTKLCSTNSSIIMGSESSIGKDSTIECNNSDINIGFRSSIGKESKIQCSNSSIIVGCESSIEKENIIQCNNSSIIIGSEILIKKDNKIECSNSIISIDSNCSIGKDSKITCKNNSSLMIGENCVFGSINFFISDNSGKVEIGKDCMVSQLVTISNNDGHPIFDIHTNKQINMNGSIIIGSHVWLGTKCTIMSGSEIGDGSIVGANSLVKNKFPNNCTIAGIPAKLKNKDIAWDREQRNPCLINNKTYWNKTIEDK